MRAQRQDRMVRQYAVFLVLGGDRRLCRTAEAIKDMRATGVCQASGKSVDLM